MEEEDEPAFDGNIKELPYIYVDNFTDKKKKAYFLSHVHSDHTFGLFGRGNVDDLINNNAKIYMSKESKTILEHRHGNFHRLKNIIEVINIGFPQRITNNGQSFQVTLIRATHMIGAVMFLFKTDENKTILFTGDFVIEKDKISDLKELHDCDGNPLRIDAMYIDATFDNSIYEHFPTWDLCHEEVVKEIKSWLIDDNRRIALFHNNDPNGKHFGEVIGSHRLGYENIYKAIHDATGFRLFLKLKQEQELYRDFQSTENVITNNPSSKIHICFNSDPQQMSHDFCGVSPGDGLRYLHIYVSAMRGRYYTPDQPAISKESEKSLYLRYSGHCSKSQLDHFIEYFSPARIVKFPRNPVGGRNYNAPTKKQPESRKRDDGNVKKQLHL